MKRGYFVLFLGLHCLIISCHKDLNSTGLFSPRLITEAATNITDTSATAGVSYDNPVVVPFTSLGVELATDSNFSIFSDPTPYFSSTSGPQPFRVNLTNLFAGTQYYIRAQASTTLNQSSHGNTVSFTTTYTPSNYTVTTLAGSGIAGLNNEPSTRAQFSNPDGAAVDPAGNIYIADNKNNAIRVISFGGGIGTFATTDGAPFDVVADNQGNLYVAEASLRILKITPGGQVSVFAGNGIRGSADGTGTAASFNSAFTLSIDPAGNLYVGDGTAFRKITPAGVVTTLTSYFGTTNMCLAITVDKRNNIYETNGISIIRIDSLGNETLFAGGAQPGRSDGTGSAASFSNIDEMRTDTAGNIYATDPGNNSVRMITPSGVVTTIAGNGAYGNRNGNGAIATFNSPIGLTPDNAGNIIVCDLGNNVIREISPL
jgi:sugar lactone lactonase YvrE